MNRRRFLKTTGLAATLGLSASLRGEQFARKESPAQEGPALKIRIKLRNEALTATLADSPTSKDFASLLPLTLKLQDYASTEKISDLPRRLSTVGAPEGHDPEVGDITYYAPWGNLAIFHNDFRYSSGLIKLGKIEGSVKALASAGAAEATIEVDG